MLKTSPIKKTAPILISFVRKKFSFKYSRRRECQRNVHGRDSLFLFLPVAEECVWDVLPVILQLSLYTQNDYPEGILKGPENEEEQWKCIV